MVQLSGEKQVNRTRYEVVKHAQSPAKNGKLREQSLGRLVGFLRLFVADHDVDKVILSESGGMVIEL